MRCGERGTRDGEVVLFDSEVPTASRSLDGVYTEPVEVLRVTISF